MQNKEKGQLAIMLFTRTAEEEAEAKSLSGAQNSTCDRQIGQLLIDHATLVAEQSGFPLFIVTSSKQVGVTFGERFSNAFRQIFEKGYSRIISIGNDCLSLRAKDLKQAASAMVKNDVVLGPTSAGGAYLIGMNRNAFDEKSFSILPWKSPKLLDSLVSKFSSQLVSLRLLGEKNDVNNHSELLRELSSPAIFNRLKQQLIRLLHNEIPWTIPEKEDYLYLEEGFSISRAPPVIG